MTLNEAKNHSVHPKHLHLAKIAQIGGADSSASLKGDYKVPNSSRSILSKKDITVFSTNSRDTTLETHRTQDLDDYSKRLIEKEADAILEGEFDEQMSLSSIKNEGKKSDPNKKKLPKVEYQKVNRNPGIGGYLNYLSKVDDYDLGEFRQKMKEKLRLPELNQNLSNIQSSDTFLGSKLHEAIMQRQEQVQRMESMPELVPMKILKNRDLSKSPKKISRLKIVTRDSEKNLSLTRDSSNATMSGAKTERVDLDKLFDRDKLKETLQILATEYEIFMNHSSRQKDIYYNIKSYIMDKPDMLRIFYNKKAQRFREPLTHQEIYKGLQIVSEFSHRGSVRFNRRESSISPLLRRKSPAETSLVRIPERLSEQIKFFTAELKAANLHYELKQVHNLEERVERKEGEIQNKFYRLSKKLYNIDRTHYKKFRGFIENIEKDRPYLRMRLDDKLSEFEKHAGELPLIQSSAREIGKAWDNLITNWANTRERIVRTDHS